MVNNHVRVYNNNYGTGEYILLSALYSARRGYAFRFGNIGKRKALNMLQKYVQYMMIQDRRDKIGDDTTNERAALALIKRELDRIM